ncbi:MFS transporter [Luteipulveratus mongoliensis]|uniref:Major facilitator superfamily (MFS) profile domain-containing protein n=1 Tax=Luteipulveratus mongoliensis TaxID=571913 RepID=A0A0K1JH40_9MICO|nr:MFS transporter [Luteipulveratus mongoliensis]AKU15903.1 hypothetical protein VV02_08625 [Luteipulveratus mongoliensis]
MMPSRPPFWPVRARSRSPVRVYYALQLLRHLPTSLVVVVHVVSDLHLGPLDLVLMGVTMQAATVLCELPTGVIADIFGRRASMVLGFFGMGVAWLLVGLVSSAITIIVLWGLYGVAQTLVSGAREAWLADEIGEERIGAVLLVGARVRYAGSVLGLVGQLLLGLVSLRAAIVAGGLALVTCGCVCLLRMPETGFVAAGTAGGSARPLVVLRRGCSVVRASRVATAVLVAQLPLGAVAATFDRLREAHFLSDIGLPRIGDLDPLIWFGMLWLLAMCLGFAGTGMVIRLEARGGVLAVGHALTVLTVIELLALLAFGLTGSTWLALGAVLAVFFARDLAGPARTIMLNAQITSSAVRATVLSLSGQVQAVGQVVGGTALGLIGGAWGIRAALVGAAVTGIPAILLYVRGAREMARVKRG